MFPSTNYRLDQFYLTEPLGIDHSVYNQWSYPKPSTQFQPGSLTSQCICTLSTHDEYRRVHTHNGVLQCIVPGCCNGFVPIPEPKPLQSTPTKIPSNPQAEYERYYKEEISTEDSLQRSLTCHPYHHNTWDTPPQLAPPQHSSVSFNPPPITTSPNPISPTISTTSPPLCEHFKDFAFLKTNKKNKKNKKNNPPTPSIPSTPPPPPTPPTPSAPNKLEQRKLQRLYLTKKLLYITTLNVPYHNSPHSA